MSGFIQGKNRFQSTLLPERLDDFIHEDNSVRVVDAFVEDLDLADLGFKTTPADTGRPGYHPSALLKLYIYGYLNRIQSSRRLERETHRNLELMWLIDRLQPDFKTIADFRRNNGKAIKKVCREFIVLCRSLNLFVDAVIAVDGSKFKAVNSRENNFTKAKLKQRMDRVEQSLDHYLEVLAIADREERPSLIGQAENIQAKIDHLKQKRKELKQVEQQLKESGSNQISRTDPDARSMMSSRNGSGTVGYNVQAAVDTKHHLIVVHDVTNQGSDRTELSPMSIKAKLALNRTELPVLADRGYYSAVELQACEQEGVETYVPKSFTSGNRKKGQFDRADFIWIESESAYRCPAGQKLTHRATTVAQGKRMLRYWYNRCDQCQIKSHCTTGKERRVDRWEHEDILERVEQRLERLPNAMVIRKATAEHPFGTLKSWMGHTHFTMKRLEHVATEMSLHVLAYNLKRVLNILGSKQILSALQP